MKIFERLDIPIKNAMLCNSSKRIPVDQSMEFTFKVKLITHQ